MLDPKWLEALKLPLRVTLAVAVASGVLLLLDLNGVLDLGPLEPFTRPVLIIVVAVSGALSLVGIAEPLIAPLRERQRLSLLATRRAVRRREEAETRAEAEATILARLDFLSAEELRFAADAIRKNTPTFYAYLYNPAISMMRGKGLVWTPLGGHDTEMAFAFHDFVWKALLARKDEFIAKDEENKRAEDAAKLAQRRRGY